MTTPNEPTPLTAEEIEALRRDHFRGALSARCWECEWEWPCPTARLLVTLGAARATPEPLPRCEHGAVREPCVPCWEADQRAEPLREALDRIEALPRQTVHADPFFPETYDYETVPLDAVRAALASPRAASALDVERLARVFWNMVTPIRDWLDAGTDSKRLADLIAREYATLASQPAERGEG